MLSIDEILAQLRDECSDDYVGVWEIVRLLRDNGYDPRATAEVATIASRLLVDPAIAVGQFDDGQFSEWTGDVSARVAQLRSELAQLGRDPDIGEVAWFAIRG